MKFKLFEQPLVNEMYKYMAFVRYITHKRKRRKRR